MERKTKNIQGYNVDILTFQEAVTYTMLKLSKQEGMHIITLNPEIIELANKKSEYADIIKKADLVVADGTGIKLALRLKGVKQERIAGIDLAKELMKVSSKMHYTVALVGAKENVVQSAKRKLKIDIPKVRICYTHNGYFSIPKSEEIVEELEEAEPDIVLVALGAPKQDIFIDKCRKKLPHSVFIGVGGSFDVWAGEVKRAPKLIRAIGCEWIYRTIKQPKRMKRIYKTLPTFLFKAIIDSVKDRPQKN